MRKIILHAATLDRRGNYRDAGSELTVGAEDNDDTDITTAKADELLDAGRAVTLSEAAEQAKAEPVDPEPAPTVRKAKA